MSFRTIAPRLTPLLRLTPRLPTQIRTITNNPLPNLQDPYPLPLSKPELATSPNPNMLSENDEDWPIPAPLDRTGEDEKTLRARLVYQTRKRGTLETDLILSTFARDQLGGMGLEELREFDKMLDEPDWDIYYWSIQKREPPTRWKDTDLLKKLIQHAKNEGKVVRMMPPLADQVASKA